MMVEQAEDNGVRVRVRGREMSVAITEEQVETAKRVARHIVREPFTSRPWSELAFYLVSGGLAGVGLAFVGCTLLLPLLLHGVPGNIVRFTPESIYANSVADVVPTGGALSSTTGFLLMVGYAAAALALGGSSCTA